MPTRSLLTIVVAVPVIFLAGGCGSSGSSGASTTSTSSGTTAAGAGGSAAAGTSSTSSAAGGATFDGDHSGTVAANLGTGGVMSIDVTVTGDASPPHHGSISATSAGFVGPDAADLIVPSGGAKPVVSGSTYPVDGVRLEDVVVSHESVTLHGSLTCP